MARKTWMPAVIALGLAFTNAQGDDPPRAPSKAAMLMRWKLGAAQKVFKQVWDSQGGDVEAAYQWSCRWLEAERELSARTEDRVAALRAHLLRMREIQQVLKGQFRQRITTLFQVRTSEFFVAEAELWVVQAMEQGGDH